MKPCTTCAYYRAFGTMKQHHYCLHPENRSLVTGTAEGAFGPTAPRGVNGVCGPDGHLHSSTNTQHGAYLRRQ